MPAYDSWSETVSIPPRLARRPAAGDPSAAQQAAASPSCAARAAISRAQATPDTGVRRVPVERAPAQASGAGPVLAAGRQPGRTAYRRNEQPGAADRQRRHIGRACLPPPPSDMAQAIASAKPLSDAEAASFAAALKAIDDGRYADARADGRQLQQSAAHPLHRLEHPAGRAQDRRRLRLDLALPARKSRLARARGAAPPGRGPHRPRHAGRRGLRATSPPSRRSPAPATCAASRRPRPSAPATCRSSRATAGATPRSARPTRTTSSTRYGQLPDGRRPDRPLRSHPARRPRPGRARPAAQAAARLPAARQCAAGHGDARGRCADRAARRVGRARLDEPAIKLERLAWLRRTGNLDEAKALLTAPVASQTEAWWNERQQLARDLLAAGRAADAYAVTVHPRPRPRASPSPRPSSSPAGSRSAISSELADAQKHFQTLYDGVATDISKSRAAYWLGRAHRSGRPCQGSQRLVRPRRRLRPDLLRPARGAPTARPAPPRLPSDPVASAADQQALGGRELVTMARYLGQAGDFERTRPFLLRLARIVERRPARPRCWPSSPSS